MESTGKDWIPVFNILEKTCWVTLAHPKYTKPQKGNKTDRKDAKWICDLYMCGMWLSQALSFRLTFASFVT